MLSQVVISKGQKTDWLDGTRSSAPLTKKSSEQNTH
jgi:hypothetical protein